MEETNKKLMMAGLFLSKFNKAGLDFLGFTGFVEAYNALALSVGGAPSSIKNYRDEFDPYFPNGRKGWANRALRPTRKRMMEQLESLPLKDFGELIQRTFAEDGDIEVLHDKIKTSASDGDQENSSFAKRMITGCAAENYFEKHYREIAMFTPFQIKRTTSLGCGFDFKMTSPKTDYLAVEVKGIVSYTGAIQLTSKEHEVADYLRDRYYLYVVRNFAQEPTPLLIHNPLHSEMVFSRHDIVSRQQIWVSMVE